MKNANVPKDHYLRLNYTVPTKTSSDDETSLKISIEFRLRNPNDSATFDVFKLDRQDFQCYLDEFSKNQNNPCEFLDDSEKTFLNIQSNRTIDVLQTTLRNVDSSEIFFIIDNTKFPENGANYKNDFDVEVLYHLDVEPSDEFYLKTIILGIAFGIIFIFSFGLLIYCLIKCKKHQSKYKELTEEKVKGF